MKEKIEQSLSDSQIHSSHTQETVQARRVRIQKNRAIRKSKVNSKIQHNQGCQNVSSYSRQEKLKMQKVKNREAAQKSREQKKVYIASLEKQIIQLKEKINKPNYCAKCQKLIDNSETNQENSFDNSIEENIIEEPTSTISHQNQFMRIVQHDSNSSIGLFLFISMSVIAIACFTGAGVNIQKTGFSQPRQLLQVTQPLKAFKNDMLSLPQAPKQITYLQSYKVNKLPQQQLHPSNMLVPINKSLFQFNQDDCLKQIISHSKIENEGDFRQGLMNLRESLKKQSNPNNILFCQIPRIYRGNGQKNIFTNFLDIIVSGSQIMEVIDNGNDVSLKNLINLDGIYELKAEIKQIVKLDTFPSCLV